MREPDLADDLRDAQVAIEALLRGRSRRSSPWRSRPGSRCTACRGRVPGCKPSRCPAPRPCAASTCACRRSRQFAGRRSRARRSSAASSSCARNSCADRSWRRSPRRRAGRSISSAAARGRVSRRSARRRTPRAPRAASREDSRDRRPLAPTLPGSAARHTLARTRADLNFAEEVGDFPSRGIGRIRAVHDVFIDAAWRGPRESCPSRPSSDRSPPSPRGSSRWRPRPRAPAP